MATSISFSNPNQGTWFFFNEEDPESGKICLRVLTTAKQDELNKKHTKEHDIVKKGVHWKDFKTNNDAYRRDLWDYIIVEWVDLVDDDGVTPIECTIDNKVKLMSENVGFSLFVSNCIEKLNDEAEKGKGQAIKNSLSTSKPSETSRPAKDAKN